MLTKQLLISFTIFLVSSCGSIVIQEDDPEAPVTSFTEDDFWADYTIVNRTYGTKTVVSLTNDHRVMQTNALPNHNTGVFPNEGNPNTISAKNLSYKFPLKPIFSGESRWAR